MDEMRALIADLPEQLRWAASITPPSVPRASEALIIGMGGSGFAGDVAEVFASSQGRRVAVHKSYGLPGWATAIRPLVVAVSHSGDTEETLTGVEAALAAGLPVVTTSTGGTLRALAEEHGLPHLEVPPGPQPRAAAGYLSGAVLQILEASGVAGPTASGLLEAATALDGMLEGGVVEHAETIAGELAGRAAIIYGATGVASAAAGRWKTQINENGKAPAWFSVLPELNHNELVGWTAFPYLAGEAVGVVFLHDPHDSPRMAQRLHLTRRLMEGVHIAGEVTAVGGGVLTRLFSLVLVGDLVSVVIAERAGVDPVPVAVIQRLKKMLAEEAP